MGLVRAKLKTVTTACLCICIHHPPVVFNTYMYVRDISMIIRQLLSSDADWISETKVCKYMYTIQYLLCLHACMHGVFSDGL